MNAIPYYDIINQRRIIKDFHVIFTSILFNIMCLLCLILIEVHIFWLCQSWVKYHRLSVLVMSNFMDLAYVTVGLNVKDRGPWL